MRCSAILEVSDRLRNRNLPRRPVNAELNRDPEDRHSDENTYQRLSTPNSVRSWRTLIQTKKLKRRKLNDDTTYEIWSLKKWVLESFCFKTANFWFIHPVIEICSFCWSIGAALHGRKFKNMTHFRLKSNRYAIQPSLNTYQWFSDTVPRGYWDTVFWTRRINYQFASVNERLTVEKSEE